MLSEVRNRTSSKNHINALTGSTGAGQKPMKFLDMIRIYKIKKKDGSTPKTQAISSVVSKFRDFKRKRGRKIMRRCRRGG